MWQAGTSRKVDPIEVNHAGAGDVITPGLHEKLKTYSLPECLGQLYFAGW